MLTKKISIFHKIFQFNFSGSRSEKNNNNLFDELINLCQDFGPISDLEQELLSELNGIHQDLLQDLFENCKNLKTYSADFDKDYKLYSDTKKVASFVNLKPLLLKNFAKNRSLENLKVLNLYLNEIKKCHNEIKTNKNKLSNFLKNKPTNISKEIINKLNSIKETFEDLENIYFDIYKKILSNKLIILKYHKLRFKETPPEKYSSHPEIELNEDQSYFLNMMINNYHSL